MIRLLFLALCIFYMNFFDDSIIK